MKAEEFKAWFEGYTENIKKVPTQKQWRRIKERVEEVRTDTVWHNWYPNWWTVTTNSNDFWISSGGTTNAVSTLNSTNPPGTITCTNNSMSTAYMIGGQEAERDAA